MMQPLRESLERLIDAHEPNPALIVDGLWNLIESNRAASLLWDGVDPLFFRACEPTHGCELWKAVP